MSVRGAPPPWSLCPRSACVPGDSALAMTAAELTAGPSARDPGHECLQLFIFCVIVASVEADGSASGIPPESDGTHGIDEHPRGHPMPTKESHTMDFDPGKTLKDAAYIT